MKKQFFLFVFIAIFPSVFSQVKTGKNPGSATVKDKLEAQITAPVARYMTSTGVPAPSPVGKTGIDLCGIWYSHDYQCPFGVFPLETFAISQAGKYIAARKIKGDSCVTSGHLTWEGYYEDETFDITMYLGSQTQPNCCSQLSRLTVIDSSHLYLEAFSTHMYKYSCMQLDSMNVRPTDYGLNCDCGVIIIFPNPSDGVFNIRNRTGERISKVEVFNAIGQKAYSSTDEIYTMNLSGKASGIYLYKITTENNKAYCGKLLKQ